MIGRNISTLLATGSLVLLLVTSGLGQTTIVMYDFDDDSGSLLGETANTGQQWQAGVNFISSGLETGTQ